jgi:hypothetical protein
MEFTTKFKEKTKTNPQRMLLAQEFKVTSYTIDRWLDLKKSPKLLDLERIIILCEFYNVTLREIFIIDDKYV